MDGGLHPFIAFTYFSAHPLNDTHSYTLTLHPSFLPPSSDLHSFILLFHSSTVCTNGFILFLHFLHHLLCPPPTLLSISCRWALLHLSYVSISNFYPSSCALYSVADYKGQYDREAKVSKGWVGLQYTRQLQEEAMWAFFCFLPRERERVCVSMCLCVYVSASL